MIILKNENLSAIIIAEDGMNAVSIRYKGSEVIDFNGERREGGQSYSTTICFPTPGRVRGGEFEFEGRRIPAVMHGFARSRAFRVIERKKDYVKGRLSFHGDDEMYPFVAELVVGIYLEGDSIRWEFDLWNRDECNIPYGFALHPFFSKKHADGDITANVRYRLEWGDDLLSTGRLIPASTLFYDLNKGYRIRSIASDGQYITDVPFSVRMNMSNFSLEMKADEEFRFLGVYTSTAYPFFCIDPSTASYGFTDLYAQGMEYESGMQVLAPGEEKILNVSFNFKDI